MLKKNILFLTSLNLTTNPRLLKEISLASQAGYGTGIILFKLGNWSDKFDTQLRETFPQAEFIEISATRKPFLPWLIISVAEIFLRFIPKNLLSEFLLSISITKRTYLIKKALSKLEGKYDLVIAHNPASFYPAYYYSKKHNSSFAIDIEDYYPGETHDINASNRIKKIMIKILPLATYCSFAAPLIKKEVEKDVVFSNRNQFVILNGFSEKEFILEQRGENISLKLVWFSQNISFNRGLEYVIPIINELYPLVELHLFGNLDSSFKSKFLNNERGVTIYNPINQKELHESLSKFDVGLAIEPGKDMNNTIAISNKLIAFVQAGLFIIATETPGQKEFLDNSKADYELIDIHFSDLMNTLKLLISRKNEIYQMRYRRFYNGKEYSWETLSDKLLKAWQF